MKIERMKSHYSSKPSDGVTDSGAETNFINASEASAFSKAVYQSAIFAFTEFAVEV